jgi:hypothetical protein
MSKDNVFDLKKPEPFIDYQITTIIRQRGRPAGFWRTLLTKLTYRPRNAHS